jgi:hypothetical protein
MFAPPLHLVHRAGGFHGARNFAKDARRWLLANVQSEDDFACHALNRDVWGDELVENLVREGFVLWQAVSVVPFVCLFACVRACGVFVCCCCCGDPPGKCPRILILPRPSPAHGAHPFVFAAAFSRIPSAAPRLRAWPPPRRSPVSPRRPPACVRGPADEHFERGPDLHHALQCRGIPSPRHHRSAHGEPPVEEGGLDAGSWICGAKSS